MLTWHALHQKRHWLLYLPLSFQHQLRLRYQVRPLYIFLFEQILCQNDQKWEHPSLFYAGSCQWQQCVLNNTCQQQLLSRARLCLVHQNRFFLTRNKYLDGKDQWYHLFYNFDCFQPEWFWFQRVKKDWLFLS